MRVLAAGLLAIVATLNAEAALVRYDYTGNALPAGGASGVTAVTGYLIIDSTAMVSLINAAISPVEYSFTDGFTTYGVGGISPTEQNFWRFVTNSSGQIADWDISLINDPAPIATGNSYLRTAFLGTTTGLEQDLANYRGTPPSTFLVAVLNGNRGTWATSPVPAVPLPGALVLLVSGLVGLGVLRRRESTSRLCSPER